MTISNEHSEKEIMTEEDLCRGAMAAAVPGVEIECNQVFSTTMIDEDDEDDDDADDDDVEEDGEGNNEVGGL